MWSLDEERDRWDALRRACMDAALWCLLNSADLSSLKLLGAKAACVHFVSLNA